MGKYFGTYETFEMQTGVNMSSIFADNPKYSEMRRGKLQSKRIVTEQEIDELTFKEALYSYTDKKGRRRKGKGITDFVTIQKHRKLDFSILKNITSGDPQIWNFFQWMTTIKNVTKKRVILLQ